MTIYFSPAYHGHLYVDLDNKDGNIAFDCCYKNTAGLVDMLASMLGVHVRKCTDGERLANYYHAIKQCITEHPECTFAKSFKIDGMGTARQCLRWRDELSRYGWTKDTPTSSPRLQTLCLIEGYFDCDGDDTLWSTLMSALRDNADILDGSKIIVPFKKQVLAPYITELLDVLESGGCEVCYSEESPDYERLLDDVSGIKVWEFETERDAILYLATTSPDRFDVWVDHDSRMLDKYLHAANRPTVGSIIAESYPQSCQLLTLALKLLRKPVDAVTLVQWLQLPKHPVKSHWTLAEKIISTGGYHNDECKALVEDNDEWLPELKAGEAETECDKVKISTLNACVKRYREWAQRQINLSANMDDYNFPSDYFDGLIDLCDALDAMLSLYDEKEEVDCDIIDGWCQRLTSAYKRPQHPAVKFCMEMVESAASMVDSADSVIVCDAYGDWGQEMSCSFLSAGERADLSQYIKLWDGDAEREYHKSLMFMPLLMADKELVLVVCKKSGNEDLPQHPLVTWLKGRLGDDYKAIVEHQKLDSRYHNTPKAVDHHCEDEHILFDNKHLLRYRKHESPSTIETLFESPLEYVFKNIVYLTPGGETEMKTIQVTKGVVAHYIIATLFSPDAGCGSISADEIRVRIKARYYATFDVALHYCGSMLLRPENSLECRKLRKEVRECINILVNVIDKNSLRVISCEYNVEDTEIGINGAAGTSVPVKGRVDMVLRDTEGCAVVFDLKYTGSPSRYYDKLSGGTAYQLALYAEMLKASAGMKVTRVGYYIMPRGVLYTCDTFTGEHIWHIPSPASINAFTTVKTEYQRILDEIANGKIGYRDANGTCMIKAFSKLKLFYD